MTDSPKGVRLLSVGGLLERGVDLDIILATIVDEVVRQLDADRGTLYLVDPDRRQIFSKAAHLPELPEIRLEIGQGIAGAVAETGDVINLTDPYGDVRFERNIDARTGYKTHSMLVAPIRAQREVIGVLQVLNKTSGHFDDGDGRRLQDLADQASEVIQTTSLYAQLKTRPKGGGRPVDYRYNFIVGTSAVMRQVYELVDKAADTSATVIIQGESGTGKGLIARAIHMNSARRNEPFVVLDCTTLPPSLIENEIFGHESGAYTGADRTETGKLELADGGTLFIDEIGELPLELQSKLLRVIQEREFQRVGGHKTIRVDFRLVAATNRDLDKMVADGTFRTDLYYRIHVVPILLPPLRKRGPEDIQRLAEHFLSVFTKKHRQNVLGISPGAMRRLVEHRWPGNIRELENCIESAVVLSDGDAIKESHLALPPATRDGDAQNSPRSGGDLSRSLAAVDHDYILAVIEDAGGNQSEAARRLGISRNTLARKLKGYEGG